MNPVIPATADMFGIALMLVGLVMTLAVIINAFYITKLLRDIRNELRKRP